MLSFAFPVSYTHLDVYKRQSGYNLGFMMVDLKTGQGVASSSEQFFYSASTIKGPYVASINKYDPGSAWAYSGIMQQTIGISSNSGYATLRNSCLLYTSPARAAPSLQVRILPEPP